MDDFGVSDTDLVEIIVQDTTPPSLTSPPDASWPVGIPVNLGPPTVWDIADPNPVVTNDAPAEFTGSGAIVTWTAVDSSGNVTTATQMITLVDASFDKDVVVGWGLVVEDGVSVDKVSSVGNNVHIGADTFIDKDGVIGNDVLIGIGVVIKKEVVLGDSVQIGDGARIEKGSAIGDGARIGVGAVIQEGVVIGEGAVIGDGVNVEDDVPPGATIGGAPTPPAAP